MAKILKRFQKIETVKLELTHTIYSTVDDFMFICMQNY